jgi:beta-glucosidase
VEELYVDTADLMLVDYTPVLPASHPNPDEFYMDLHASFTVPSGESGTWDFGLIVCGTCKFFLDGSLVIDNSVDQVPGGTFFGAGTIEKPGHFILEAGRTYSVLIQFGSAATSAMVIPGVPAMRGGGLRLGGVWSSHPAADIENAVRVARDVDQVVIIAGLNSDWECEGYDRSHMSLPGLTDTLISAVAAVNRNTAVVVQSGTPVAMPWINEVGAVAQAWYGGNETGNGIADVLFGGVCPSGKLPLSFPVRNEDNPAFLNFRSERGRVLYGEDVYVGYRFYEATQKEVLFPFGHGLSYTSFELSGVKLEEPADAEDVQLDSTLSVEVTVKNTGAKEGAEVVQMYVSQKAPSINRPPKELKGFAKVFLKPGEEKTVKVECEMKYATSFWDEERDQWISEMGEYEVLVGNSSAHTPLKEKFVVGETRWWSGV